LGSKISKAYAWTLKRILTQIQSIFFKKEKIFNNI